MEDVSLSLPSEQRRLALEPLLEMARSNSNNDTIRALVLKALSHPQVFCGFDQIKHEIQNSSDEVLLRTLDLFSRGTYRDYAEASKASFLALTPGQVHKLRQLTVVSMVQQSCLDKNSQDVGSVSYDRLAQELGFASSDDVAVVYRQVEEVVISCIYARILSGRLCQRTKCFVMSCRDGPPCQARDVASSRIPDMMSSLQNLNAKLDATLASLRQTKTKTQAHQEQNVEYWKKAQEQANKTSGASVAAAARPTGGMWPAEASGSTSRGRDAMVGGRPSSSTNRQTKRSRGGLSGAF